MGMRSIATYILSPSFKKTQPYYTFTITLYHRHYEYTISEKHIAQYIDITGYEYILP